MSRYCKAWGKCLLAAFLALMAAERVLGVDYNVVLLEPEGFYISNAVGVSGTQQVGYAWLPSPSHSHALLWNSSAEDYVDLHPAGFTQSEAEAMSGAQQAGYGYGPATGNLAHALLWNGSPEGYIDLHPSGFYTSGVTDMTATQQVGSGRAGPGEQPHAILWSGTPESYVDLHPSGFVRSYASGIGGTQQVGKGSEVDMPTKERALLWNGSAEDYVNLHPAGFERSEASDTNGTQQVGYGMGPTTGDHWHALLWSGTPESYIDLNPPGFTTTVASDINETQQVVGCGDGPATGEQAHALLWSRTDGNVVDLHQFLPDDFLSSTAFGIDAVGNAVGYAFRADSPTKQHAVLWQVVQPPAIQVAIDIKPGSDIGPVNLNSRGVLPVAILGSEDFDVHDVDLTSLELAGGAPKENGNSGNVAGYEDVNGDDILDLVLHFPVTDLLIAAGTEELVLTGALADGTEITGSDAIRLVGGDANLDGLVNVGDLGILGANYKTGPGKTWTAADFNGDGIVNVGDLGILGANYRWSHASYTSSVPEPATLSLLCGAALPFLLRRRPRASA